MPFPLGGSQPAGRLLRFASKEKRAEGFHAFGDESFLGRFLGPISVLRVYALLEYTDLSDEDLAETQNNFSSNNSRAGSLSALAKGVFSSSKEGKNILVAAFVAQESSTYAQEP